MTIDEQNKLVLEATAMKFIGSLRDKVLWLEAHGWENRGQCKYYKSEPFRMGWRTLNEALDDEVAFALTGNPYSRGEEKR